MSEEAVEVARRGFEEGCRVKDASGRRLDALDPETLAVVYDTYDPEIEVHEDPSFPEAGVYRGIEATRRYFAQFSESFDEFTFEAKDFIDLGEDRVLVLLHIRTRGKESGATVEADPGWILTIRGGKVVRIESYLDQAQARAVVGLEASG